MDKLIEYLQYDFVQYAIIVGTLIAFCSAILGSVIVPKKMSFAGDGLSHVAFGATTLASILGLTNSMYIVLPATIIFSVFLLKNTENKRTPNDALLAVISVAGLAFGYMSLNIFSKSSNLSGDVCGFLFGATSILTLTTDKVVLCCILSVIVIIAFVLLYNKIYATTFDETFAAVSGTKLKAYKTITAILIDIIIVLAINLVGTLLISALIILPTLTAMRICNSFKRVVVISAVISVIGALSGLLIAIYFGTPVGCTIVAIDVGIFVISYVFSVVKGN